jgi:hypothetical protein
MGNEQLLVSRTMAIYDPLPISEGDARPGALDTFTAASRNEFLRNTQVATHIIGVAGRNYDVGPMEVPSQSTKDFRITHDGLTWALRAHPSISAVALRPGEMPRLQWSFEGVPTDILKRPVSTEDAKRFVSMTDELAVKLMPFLAAAYEVGLKAINGDRAVSLNKRDEEIRIRFADNNGQAFAALVDAMGLEGVPFADVEKGRNSAYPTFPISKAAKEGAGEVTRFVHSAVGARSGPGVEMTLNSDLPGIDGVLCIEESKKGITVAGVARGSGMGGIRPMLIRSPPEYDPTEYFKAISGALPLSEKLARQKGKKLERNLCRAAPQF